MAVTPPQKIQWVILAGSSVIGIATAGGLALTQDKRIYVPLVALGIVLTVVRIFWKWEHGPHRDEILNLITGNGYSAYLFMLALCAPVLVIVFGLLFAAYSGASVHPCLCLSDAGGRSWLNLTVGAWVGSFMMIAVLCSIVVLILGLYRLRRREQP
ncbi:MAG: hypothetical protein OJF49_003122 [Ktedonobacterales bacterium]|jgi:hypothetical protein|nr:MAG: hypothetical protein OJF49_003122 [Ktedonobacterales bacterium]